MIYYTSDLHLGHANIIRLCNRPFENVEEMDKAIIDNFNQVVNSNDDVYILGDVIYKSGKRPEEYLRQLNGKKHLIVGNHDGTILKNSESTFKYLETINKLATIQDEGHQVILCHYPMAEWEGFFRGSIHLYGHVHNNEENAARKIMKNIPNAFNVGVDIWDFKPVTLKEILSGGNR